MPILKTLHTVILLFILLISGVAAVVNQIVWQRALKIYLAGSDALSSIIVVMVFMAGLGIGALVMGKIARKITKPLFLLGIIELALMAFNFFVLLLLALDISYVIHVIQDLTSNLNISRYLIFAILSILILSLPCLLMGMTIPLASATSQNLLNITDKRFLSLIFFLNTLGAVLGVFITGLYALPMIGQNQTLLLALSANGLAGLLSLFLSKLIDTKNTPTYNNNTKVTKILSSLNIISFLLGFLALSYEMYLFRAVVLAHYPLPDRFSIILGFYLLFWAIGLLLANLKYFTLTTTLFLMVLATLGITILFEIHYWSSNVYLFSILYTSPCILMGILFTKVVEHGAKLWGEDIGYIQGFNTIGSCLGILLVGLYGYEINFLYLGVAIATGYFLLFLYAKLTFASSSQTSAANTFSLYASIIISVFIIVTFSFRRNPNITLSNKSKSHFYFGREGVIEISPDRNVFLNRLWHSNLSSGNDIGTTNWIHAAIPFLTVPCNKNNLEVLVIGLGTGITASSLARSHRVANIDAYEINPKIKQVMQDFPEGSLNILDNPKINIYWEDARSGLSLRTKKYDLILQAPLYLKQAGSSILLSKEYFNLISQRLKPDGLFSIYSNSLGHLGPALLVRNTAKNVFKYGQSFNRGYILIVSNNQITYPACSVSFNTSDQDSKLTFEEDIAKYGIAKLANMLDIPKLDWGKNEIIITDDRPLVEYPFLADAVMSK